MGAEDRGPTIKSPAQAVEEGQDHNITEWNQFRIMMALFVDFTYDNTTDSFKLIEKITGQTDNDSAKCFEIIILE